MNTDRTVYFFGDENTPVEEVANENFVCFCSNFSF